MVQLSAFNRTYCIIAIQKFGSAIRLLIVRAIYESDYLLNKVIY